MYEVFLAAIVLGVLGLFLLLMAIFNSSMFDMELALTDILCMLIGTSLVVYKDTIKMLYDVNINSDMKVNIPMEEVESETISDDVTVRIRANKNYKYYHGK